MKNLILFSLVCILFACNNSEQQNNAVSLEGTITNPTAENFRLITKDSTYTIDLDSLNHFKITFPLNESEYMKFWHGPEYGKLFLKPGDDIKLALDGSNFDATLAFTGEGAMENNYLIQSLLYEQSLGIDTRTIFSLDKKNFFKQLDSLNQLAQTFTDNFVENEPNIDMNFINFERAKLKFDYASNIINYPGYHRYFTQEEIPLDDNETSSLKEVYIDDEKFLKISEFINFTNAYIEWLANKEMPASKPVEFLANQFKILNTLSDQQEIKNEVLYHKLNTHLKQIGTTGLENILADFNKACTNEAYKEEINTLYEKWSKLAAGQPAFGFSYLDIEGNEVALSDFKGKYVYIDVWATWCGPCKREIPFLTKIEEEFHDKNIVFMSISTDENKEAWERMVKEKNMQGVQLHAGRGSSISKDYIINFIPRFILIDPEGNIVNSNAPRPSGNLSQLLNSLEGINA